MPTSESVSQFWYNVRVLPSVTLSP